MEGRETGIEPLFANMLDLGVVKREAVEIAES